MEAPVGRIEKLAHAVVARCKIGGNRDTTLRGRDTVGYRESRVLNEWDHRGMEGLHVRGGRSYPAQCSNELVKRICGAERVNRHTSRVVTNDSVDPGALRQLKHPRPVPNPLHRSSDLDMKSTSCHVPIPVRSR
jgi:hypothetical protein